MVCKLFWRVLRSTYPWFPLTIYFWRMITFPPVQQKRAQLKFWILYSRIDFASLLAIAIDFFQPEFWV